MFSVIIPLYNKESTILRSLRSVLNQSFTEIEIIIVNDGSTDNSLRKIEDIKDKRLKLLSKENGGVSSARNFGIKRANNELITFLDADDEWLPDYLESIWNLVKKYPECSMFGAGRLEDAAGTRTTIISQFENNSDFIIEDYCKEPYIIQMSSLCIRMGIIQKSGHFPVGIKIGEDTDFKLRAACHTRIAYLNEPKTIYYLAMENNSFSYKCKITDIFPYWKWYFYSYKPKYSLFLYTTKKVIERFRRAYLPNTFKSRIPK